VPPARTAEVLDNPELAATAAIGPEAPGGGAPLEAESTGGGALGVEWLLLLALAACLLKAETRRA
jgi:hypothetical protein